MSTVDAWNAEALLYVIQKVEGWFDPRLIEFYNAIRHQHLEHGVKGNLLEVGVHKGRSFLPLAMMAREGERAVGVDLYTGPPYESGPEVLIEHTRALGLAQRVSVVHGDLKAAIRATPSPWGTFRVVSVDGDHSADGTYEDLVDGWRLLCRGGVLIVDDVWNDAWPAVAQGFFRFVLQYAPIPIATAHGRTFLTVTRAAADSLRARFLRLDQKPVRESILFHEPFLSW